MSIGNLVFVEDNRGKKRPHICVWEFTNSAGVVYDWLILPITSNKTVGDKNLVVVSHPKLKVSSFAKLNNMRTVSAIEKMEVHDQSFSDECICEIIKKLQDTFKNIYNE